MYSRTGSRFRLAALAAVALFGGCAVQESARLPAIDDWETRREVLGDVRSFSFSGRIAVSDGEEGFNGNLRWYQNRRHYDAHMSGPLGAGTVRIQGDGRRLTVTEKDGTVTELRDARRELRARYGWSIPVASLRYWALGIPDPALPVATRFGDDGLLQRMVQGGWTVTIDRYAEGGGQTMPRRMTATGEDSRVRLVIDRWVFR